MRNPTASSYEEIDNYLGGSGDLEVFAKDNYLHNQLKRILSKPKGEELNSNTLAYTKHSWQGPTYNQIMEVLQLEPPIASILINRNIRNLELDPKDVCYWLFAELLKSRGKSRDNICDLLVNLKQPEIILESAVKMFLDGAGEDSLLFSISILESNGIESFNAFKKIFESDFKEKEIFVGPFIYISKDNSGSLSECLRLISQVKDSIVIERLIEHLDGVPKILAEKTLEYLRSNMDEDMAKETIGLMEPYEGVN